MSLLESIKADKKMSLKHWRYRILHWCFNEPWDEWDGDWPQSGLPDFLYTHYCPLFHLTNLIAILFPIILMVKIIEGICVGIKKCFNLIPWERMETCFTAVITYFVKHHAKKTSTAEQPSIDPKTADIKKEKIRLLRTMLSNDMEDFDYLWNIYDRNFKYLSREDAKVFFETRIEKIIATKK